MFIPHIQLASTMQLENGGRFILNYSPNITLINWY